MTVPAGQTLRFALDSAAASGATELFVRRGAVPSRSIFDLRSADLTPDQLDLTVNMVSFQEMTTAQVTSYVRRAHELGARFLYSLNRERSGYNHELDSVSRIVAEYYWPREVSILKVSYQKMLDEAPGANDYTHIVGWKRVKVDSE